MADEPNAGAQVAPQTNAPAPVAPVTPPVTPPTSAPVAAPSGDELTPEQLRDALRKAREEAAKVRIDAKEYAELKKEKADREAASLTEQEKLAKRATDAEAAAQAARGRIGAYALQAAAQAAGTIDHEVVGALLASKVEYDASGEPTNIADLITKLQADKPHLFTQAGQPAAPTRPAPTSGGAMAAGRQQAAQPTVIPNRPPLTFRDLKPEDWRGQRSS